MKITCTFGLFCLLLIAQSFGQDFAQPSQSLFQKFCFDCHDRSTQEGNLDLQSSLEQSHFDRELVFENVITKKMPPDDADQPSGKQRQAMLDALAESQPDQIRNNYRRITRHEFNHSFNDLLGIEYDIASSISDDRGTHTFDSDRRVLLTKEMLAAYFSATDQMLDFAFPASGFLPETTWKTNRVKASLNAYNTFTRPFKDGILFSWTRANNGNGYSFFYDDFEPPAAGWYELTFDAGKVGDFKEDIALQVHAGKYYFADDRPQPQRLIDVISLSDKKVKSHTVRGFFHPGENVSVHAFSKHTWRKANPKEGAYIKQLTVRGPLYDWPPKSYQKTFNGIQLKIPARTKVTANSGKSVLERLGGRVTVSSEQKGMEKEQMLDGSNRTFWHTRFSPMLAEPPHFVIFQHPGKESISGLNYSTWTGGNSNGQIKAFEIYFSDDGKNWGDAIMADKLETQPAADQPIKFPMPTRKRFIKFLITDSYSIDGRSLASIGQLDFIAESPQKLKKNNLKIVSPTKEDLRTVLRRFAKRAFASDLSEEELAPYLGLAIESFEQESNFLSATRVGLKAILCSPRFLFANDHTVKVISKNKLNSDRFAANLARTLWLSVPDKDLRTFAKSKQISKQTARKQIDRMLTDEKSSRMVHSFCNQWLNLRSFKKVSPSLKLYPLYDDLLDHYLPIETESYLRYLITENLSVDHLIDSDFAFVNQRLAQHYKIENVFGQEIRKVNLPNGSPRGGLLTMGSILKVTTDGFDTSPILRGAWISKNIAGNTLSAPPENVKAIEPDTSGAKSLREQIELHKNSETCAECHKSIDPYGFALESFDATGQFRNRYRVKLPHNGTFQYRRSGYYKLEAMVDVGGEIGERSFDDIAGLKKILLSDHKKLAYNFMKKFFEYANGYSPTLSQRIELYNWIPDDPAETRIKDMIAEVLMLQLF